MATKKGSEKILLQVEKRDIVGKKIVNLRKEGILPANVYGKDFPSQAISLNAHDFLKTFKQAGETQVIYISLDKKELPVMIHNLQIHPVTGMPLHADLRKIDLTKKIEANVPVKFINESPAVHQNKCDLLAPLDELTVEALTDAIPQVIEIDIAGLKEVNDEIRVKDLPVVADYIVKTDAEATIVKIAEHKEEELAPIPAPVVAEEGAEGVVAAGEEGKEAPAEGGDKKADEGKPEKSDKKADKKSE